MVIVIEAPEGEMEQYLEYVSQQFSEGFTSGYVRAGTYWESGQDLATVSAVITR